ncbi:MAG: hypothetical protein S4CHLAM37_05800 [Chlamydiia bacterium]|nr:hypothetical protein [Chlamydiia bacterium]
MKNIKSLLFTSFFVCAFCVHLHSKPAEHVNSCVSLEHLSNGLTYCIAQSNAMKNSVMVKLAIRFDDKWYTERERLQAYLLEMLIISTLEDKQSEFENIDHAGVAKIQMHEPELFAVPNITLYKWEIQSPTQEQMDSTFHFLSGAIETMATLDDKIIQEKLDLIIRNSKEHPSKPKRRQPFFEDDTQYPAASLEGISDIFPEITASEIKAFFLDNYKPQNMVLFVTGNTSELAISNSIKSYFSFLIALDNANQSGSLFVKDPLVARSNLGSIFNITDYKFDMDMSYKVETLALTQENFPVTRKCSEELDDIVEPKSFDRLLVSEKEKHTIYKIVHTLGTSNVPKLLWKKKEMEKMGHSINHVHPMRFIATILTNPTLRADLQEVRRSFFKWNGFIDGFRRRMTEEYYRSNIQPHVIGFCETLDVNVEVVQHFVDRKDWEGLLKAILY